MRKLMLFASLTIAVLTTGLFITHLVFAQQSTTESGTVSSDKTEAAPPSVAPGSEETDSDFERHGMLRESWHISPCGAAFV